MALKNVEARRAYAKKYYAENRKRIRAKQSEYYGTPERRAAAVVRAKKHHERVKGSVAHRFVQLKSQAKQRGLRRDLDIVDYGYLVASNRCAYCGSDLPITGHGLDRVDNRKGYIRDNVVPCCTNCNICKGLLEKIGFQYPRTVELLKELLYDKERTGSQGCGT